MGIYADAIRRVYSFIIPPKEESILNEVCLVSKAFFCFSSSISLTSNYIHYRQLVGAGKSPIGVQLAMKLSEANAKVVLVDKPSDAYESIIRKIKESGELAYFYECDVTDRHQVISLIDAVEKDVGPITKLFHGNLLMDHANEKDFKFSYINVSGARQVRRKLLSNKISNFISLTAC